MLFDSYKTCDADANSLESIAGSVHVTPLRHGARRPRHIDRTRDHDCDHRCGQHRRTP